MVEIIIDDFGEMTKCDIKDNGRLHEDLCTVISSFCETDINLMEVLSDAVFECQLKKYQGKLFNILSSPFEFDSSDSDQQGLIYEEASSDKVDPEEDIIKCRNKVRQELRDAGVLGVSEDEQIG